MKWVLNTYQTCQDWEVSRIIEVCKATGYDGIEFLMDFKQRHGVEAVASPEHVKGVARQVNDAGLIVSSLTSCEKFDAPDPAAVRKAIDTVKRVIDHAASIGCDHVRVLGDRFPEGELGNPKVVDQVGVAIGELGAYAGPAKVTVSMEMHGHFTDPELAAAVVERANQPNVGLVFNSQWRVDAPAGWSLPAGAKSIKPLYDLTGKYFTSIHTHKMEALHELDYYRELFDLLVKSGYKGYVSNECAYRGPDPEKVLLLYTALFRSFTGQTAA